MKTEERAGGGTVEAILGATQRLVQTRGYNGFSYADVAQQLGITKAAIHYHFPSKSDLGTALLARYTREFLDSLARIRREFGAPPDQLRAYASLYVDVLAGNRLCLCGMLAAERDTLPTPMREAVAEFFDANLDWLRAVLIDGASDKSLDLTEDPSAVAELLLGGLEGGMLVAWSDGSHERFRATTRHLVRSLTGTLRRDVEA